AARRSARGRCMSPPPSRRPARTVRPQLAAEVLLTLFAVVFAAAVADWRVAHAGDQKLKKTAGATPSLALVENPDILAAVARDGLVTIGFAAETERLEANAAAKLHAKALDMIVANDASATIGAPTSQAVILRPDETPERLPAMPKAALASIIVDRLASLLADRREDDA
ncbi:MAG TPA: phosphopantothenoylcysteine decarboxylase, partial [Thermomicrobiales bacterium]|nr:phosphopantothenoylcysteine decarboxylase [Thermomicrobiales bacterium]